MKQILLMALGAAVLYQVAKKNGIHSFSDMQAAAKKLISRLNLDEWLSIDKLKELVAPVKRELTSA